MRSDIEYRNRLRGRIIVSVAIATGVVAVAQATWYVFAILGSYDDVRSQYWWVEALLKAIMGNLVLGIVPAVIAMAIATPWPASRLMRICAATFATAIGALLAFWMFSLGYSLIEIAEKQAWAYSWLGFCVYVIALLGDTRIWNRR